MHQTWTQPTGWSKWAAVPGARLNIDSEIVATSRSPWTIDVFARSTDDHVITATWSRSGEWSTWSQLPGTVNGGPSAAYNATDQTYAVGAVSHATSTVTAAPIITTWNPSTKAAGSWTRVPANVYPTTGPGLAYRSGGTLELWITNSSGQLASATRPSGGSWTGYTVRDTATLLTSSPSVAVPSTDLTRADIVARGSSGQVVHAYSTSVGTLAGGFEQLAGSTPAYATPSSLWWSTDEAETGTASRYDVYVTASTDLGLYRKEWSGSAWSSWSGPQKSSSSPIIPPAALPTALTPPATVAAVQRGGPVSVFVRNPADGELLTTQRNPTLSGPTWSRLGLTLAPDSDVSAVYAGGRMTVFVRDRDNYIRARVWSSSGWESSWYRVGAAKADAGPNATVGADGLLYVGVATGGVGSIRTYDPVGKVASTLTSVGTVATWGNTAPAAFPRANGSTDVLTTAPQANRPYDAGGYGRLTLFNKRVDGTTSSVNVIKTKVTSAPSVAPRPDVADRVDLRARDVDATVWHAISLSPGTVSSTETVGGTTSIGAKPSSMWWSGGTSYEVWTVGGAGNLPLSRAWSPSAWNAWSSPAYGSYPTAKAAGERMPLARRSESSMRSHLMPAQPGVPNRLLTPETKLEMSNRWSVFTADDTPESELSRDLIAWSPMKTHAYWNATGVNYSPYDNAPPGSGTTNSARLQYVVNNNLLIPAANPTAAEPYARIDHWLALDLRKDAARRWWLYGNDNVASCPSNSPANAAALDLLACGYKGLWLDNVVFSISTFANTGVALPASVTQADWTAGVVKLLRELREAAPAGTKYTVNTQWSDPNFDKAATGALDPRSDLLRELGAADQVIIEGGAPVNRNYREGNWNDSNSIQRLLGWADAIHTTGGRVQWEITNSTLKQSQADLDEECQGANQGNNYTPWAVGSARDLSHRRQAKFNLTAALLAYVPGDGIGDNCEYPGTGWAGYDAVKGLGRPVAARLQTNPPNSRTDIRFIKRDFEHGSVVINQGVWGYPNDVTTTTPFTITPGFREIDDQSTPLTATSYPILPRAGSLFVRSNLAPAEPTL